MKRNKFIFFSAFIIILFTSTQAFSFDVKNIIDSAKEALGISKKASTPSQVKPAPAAKAPAQSQVKPAPAVTAAPVQGKNPPPPAVATKVPAQSQVKPSSAVTTVPAQGKTPPSAAVSEPAANQAKSVPPGTTVPPPAQNQAVPASPAGAVTAVGPYSYNPVGKTDPFNPFIVVERAEKKQAEKKASTSIFPLQRAETDSYRVVGIAGTEDHRVAIVEDMAKKFYPLLKGTRIGLNNGKVVEIMTDRVIVEEEDDNKKAKRVILKLRKN